MKIIKIISLVSILFLLCSCNRPKYEQIDIITDNNQTTNQDSKALPETSVLPEPMADKQSLSTKKISHSYGVAKNGEANEISINTQKYFEDNSFNAFCLDMKSDEKVLYLTFDCGYENGYTSKILDVLKEKG